MKNLYKLCILLLAGVSVNGIAQTTFLYTGSVDTYVVPTGITSISIEAKGSAGTNGSSGGIGGPGATMYGEFSVTPGDVLEFYVGGNTGILQHGGEGTYVNNTTTGTLFIVAGGGGGAAYTHNGSVGSATTTGTDVFPSSSYGDGTPGTAGNGGTAGLGAWGTGGGGGWFTAGTDGGETPGGLAPCRASAGSTFAGGAGGGYSGGAGVAMDGGWGTRAGGGGGSYNAGIAQLNTSGSNTGLGELTITELCSGLITSISADTVCEGESITLSATSATTGTVSWDLGVSDGVAFTPPLGTTTYTATSTDPADCPFSIDILVNALPTVDAGLDITVCAGDSVMLSGTGTANIWNWSSGVIDGVNFAPSTGTTTYVLTGEIDSTGCSATDMVDVTLNSVNIAVVTSGGAFTALQAGATYQWVDCPAYTPISGATSQSYTPNASGSFAVIINSGGCVDTSACTTIALGFDDFESNSFTVKPNPNNGSFTLAMAQPINGIVTLFGMDGKMILSKQVNQESIVYFDLENYQSGVYLMQISNETEIKTIRVVIE